MLDNTGFKDHTYLDTWTVYTSENQSLNLDSPDHHTEGRDLYKICYAFQHHFRRLQNKLPMCSSLTRYHQLLKKIC